MSFFDWKEDRGGAFFGMVEAHPQRENIRAPMYSAHLIGMLCTFPIDKSPLLPNSTNIFFDQLKDRFYYKGCLDE